MSSTAVQWAVSNQIRQQLQDLIFMSLKVRLQADATKALDTAMAAGGHRRHRENCATRDIVSSLEPWHLEGMSAILRHEGLSLPTVVAIKTRLAVRGCSLVSSAFGMLTCPQAVEVLVAKWTAGPWAGRLRAAWDYIIVFQSCDTTGMVEETPDVLEQLRKRYGRFKPHAPPIVAVDTPDGLRSLREDLRSLKPQVAGGGRTALCLPMVRLPRVAWTAEQRLFGDKSNEGITEAQKAEAWEIMRGAVQQVGPATAAVVNARGEHDWSTLALAQPFEIEVA
jgi:hypothetical protein